LNIQTKKIIYLLLTLVTIVSGYVYLRYTYKVTDTFPFTQEIILIILGTLVTIFITSLLLNQQTAVEIEKEQSIKFLDLKTNTYEKLLNLMEEMSVHSKITQEEITKLQFITHRLAIFSSALVLEEYNNFLKVIANISKDGSFVNDTEELSEALSKLTVVIRDDLLNEKLYENTFSKSQIKKMISKNSDKSSSIKLNV
jgi:hypothetical protein